jgi:hypothetical protein
MTEIVLFKSLEGFHTSKHKVTLKHIFSLAYIIIVLHVFSLPSYYIKSSSRLSLVSAMVLASYRQLAMCKELNREIERNYDNFHRHVNPLQLTQIISNSGILTVPLNIKIFMKSFENNPLFKRVLMFSDLFI